MRILSTLALLAALSTAAPAQLPGSDQDHATHHPDGASAAASAPKKAPTKAKTTAAKPKPARAEAASASAARGMGMGGSNMQQMHDEMHKAGGLHDQMHGKDGKMMQSGAASGVPAPSSASK